MLAEVLKLFRIFKIQAVQQSYDIVKVTFDSKEEAMHVLREPSVKLFGQYCRIDGGPPSTIIHLFDYPFEDDHEAVMNFFSAYGIVKFARHQKYLSRADIFSGTRLIHVALHRPPPRIVNINGFTCRVWYKGQPITCNICSKQGHKSAACPDKDKCRLCGAQGHFARNCPDKDNPTPEEAARLPLPAIERPATADQPSNSQSGPVQDDQDEFHDASDGSEDEASSAPPSQSILRPPVIVPPPPSCGRKWSM